MNTIITAPLRRRYYLVFDVETTGLLPKRVPDKQGGGPSIDQYPHILQLSFAIYDMETRTIKQKYDSYVNVPDTVVINDFVSQLTGITKQICSERGQSICTVLYDFYKAYKTCEGLVAHNLEFDTKMILVELERNQSAIIQQNMADCLMLFNPIHEKVNHIDRYCTMRKGTNLCNITVPDSKNQLRRKFPKLSELHHKLFGGEMPANLHNSMVDVEVCLQCYLKMRHNIDS
jgi:hypothetical protein